MGASEQHPEVISAILQLSVAFALSDVEFSTVEVRD